MLIYIYCNAESFAHSESKLHKLADESDGAGDIRKKNVSICQKGTRFENVDKT